MNELIQNASAITIAFAVRQGTRWVHVTVGPGKTLLTQIDEVDDVGRKFISDGILKILTGDFVPPASVGTGTTTPPPTSTANQPVEVGSNGAVVNPPGFWAAQVPALTQVLSLKGAAQKDVGTKAGEVAAADDPRIAGLALFTGLTVTVRPFVAGGFTFAGGTLTVVQNGTWFIGVDMYRYRLIALPRLGHRGWVPVAKVVAGASAITSIEQITPVLPDCRIPRAMAKLRGGVALNVLVMGSSLAESTGTDKWSGMLFASGSSVANYKVPGIGTFSNVALGGTPNQYQLAQLGIASSHSGNGFAEAGYPGTVNIARSVPNGRGMILNDIDLVVLTCLANGGDYRLEIIEPIIRRLRQRNVEVILLTDNPQNPTSDYTTMSAAALYADGPAVMRIADHYGVELVDTAAFVFEQHLRYGSGIYSDTIHMSSAAPAGPATAQPSCGHEVYARAIRSVFTVSSTLIGQVEETYPFTADVEGFYAASSATVTFDAGQLLTTKNTGATAQWGAQIAIPGLKTGDTVRIQGTYAFDPSYTAPPNLVLGLQGGGAGWGSTNAAPPPGAFDVTVTANRIISSGGRVLFFGNNDGAPNGAAFRLDNITVTVNSSYETPAVDSIPGRAEDARALPPVRVVTDLKTPADAFIILPNAEHYLVTTNAARGALGAHPLGAFSFARRFSSVIGSSDDLLTLEVGEKAVFGAVGAVGFSIVRYGSTSDAAVEIEVRRGGSLIKTMNLGVPAATRELYHAILTPTEVANAVPAASDSIEITVTAGELKVAAFVTLTADITYVLPEELMLVGTWTKETTFAPGFYTDTAGSYAVARCSGRRLYWLLPNRTNSQPCDFFSDQAQTLNQAQTGVNHIRLRGGLLGAAHKVTLLSAAGAPSAGNRSLHVAGAVIVNDR